VYHDITYQFGFTEEAGNFQTNNFGKGGREYDPIIIKNNHSGKKNNSFFSAPEDGLPGVLTTLYWDTAKPNRVASFDNTILAHEYFHGVTNRLTGGAQKANCMNNQESKSLGEGWSDFFSFLMQTKSTDRRDTDFVIGSYARNSPKGLRSFPYSTDKKRNPLNCNYHV
jgi:extracellular elastinolytic metalloproteinase